MKDGERRAAIGAYKERRSMPGIYAVRCAASGEVWVGRARDLDAIQNRIWFSLRLGSNPHRTLQAAWKAHGEAAFALEEVERFPDEEPGFALDHVMKERLAHWRDALSAETI